MSVAELVPFRSGSVALIIWAYAVLVLAGPAATRAIAAQPVAPHQISAQRQGLLAERDRLFERATTLDAEGRLEEAISAAEKVLAIERRLFGATDGQVAKSLDWLSERHVSRSQFDAARAARQEALEIKTRLLGKDHWQVTDARLVLRHVELLAVLTAEQRQQLAEAAVQETAMLRLHEQGKYREALPLARQVLTLRQLCLGGEHPDTAVSLHHLAELHMLTSDFAQAEPLAKQSLEIRRKVLGKEHPETAASLDLLAELYTLSGDFSRAEPVANESLAIRRKVLGDEHADTAASLNSLAELYTLIGEFSRAEPLFQQALEIRRKVLGEEHPQTVMSLNNLGLLYRSMGDYVRAEPLFRQTVEIRRNVLGEEHPQTATSINSLAGLYDSMGDWARAEPLYLQALEIRRKMLGEEHPRTATSLNNLGMLYHWMGDYVRAEPLVKQGLEIRRKVLGLNHPSTAASLNNLGMLYHGMGEYARAEPLVEQSLEIRRNVLGEEHPDTAASLNNLALLYTSTCRYARAKPLYRQSLEIRRRVLGDEHPDTAQSFHNLAFLYQALGEYGEAEPLYRRALEISLAHLELAADVQSERQQLAMLQAVRHQLDNYLVLCTLTGRYQESAYRHLLAWKGTILARQRAARAVAAEPELRPLADELQRVTARLATLAFATPDPRQHEAWQRQIAELSERKEALERQLTLQSHAYRQATRAVTLEDVRAALPEHSVLIDIFASQGATHGSTGPSPSRIGALSDAVASRDADGDDAQHDPTSHTEGRLLAFVVDRRGPIELLNLVDLDALEAAIDTWLQSTGRTHHPAQAGRELRQWIWEPLEAKLAERFQFPGAEPAVSGKPVLGLVLVSADGALGQLPLGALPGREPSTFLIEEWPIALIPSAQALPALTASEAQPADPTWHVGPRGSVLLLGGVDYDRQAAAESPPGPRKLFRKQAVRDERSVADKPFKPLPGTQGEIATIMKTYRDNYGDEGLRVLEGAAASKSALRLHAPQYLYLHMATHGFFAEPRFRSALERHVSDPQRAALQWSTQQTVAGYHPGLLSGLVLAGANNPTEDDDGILTAEEVATLDLRGVELVVLSACETGLGQTAGGEGLLGLQRAFQAAGAGTVIASLWKVDDGATRDLMERFYDNLWNRDMGKLLALREAQLWMLREHGPRGLTPLDGEGIVKDNRLPPYYWAAFVLSGDWR